MDELERILLFRRRGWTIKQIADHLGQTKAWVQDTLQALKPVKQRKNAPEPEGKNYAEYLEEAKKRPIERHYFEHHRLIPLNEAFPPQ